MAKDGDDALEMIELRCWLGLLFRVATGGLMLLPLLLFLEKKEWHAEWLMGRGAVMRLLLGAALFLGAVGFPRIPLSVSAGLFSAMAWAFSSSASSWTHSTSSTVWVFSSASSRGALSSSSTQALSTSITFAFSWSFFYLCHSLIIFFTCRKKIRESSFWRDAITKEMKNVAVAFRILGEGEWPSFNMDFTRKVLEEHNRQVLHLLIGRDYLNCKTECSQQ